MDKEEAKNILEDQFKLIAEINKKCEPECLSQNVKCMIDLLYIIYPDINMMDV